MTKKLRIAIVGLGRIGWNFHFKQICQSSNFNLIAVVDPLEERLSEAKKFSGCHIYRSIDDLWKFEKLEVVVIATPTKLHQKLTCRALQEGSYVVLEKPMTTSLKLADKMIEEARKQNRYIFLYQPHRLTSETQTIKEIIQSNILGPIYNLRITRSNFVRRSDWQSLQKHGGGMLNNYGPHCIDQLLYLSDGSPIVDVHCNLWASATQGDADDVVKAWFKTKKGQLLDLEINQATAFSIPPWHICGSFGTAIMENKQFLIKYYNPSEVPHLEVTEGAAPGRFYDNGDRLPWRKEAISILKEKQLHFYDNVFNVIVNKDEPYIKLEEIREQIRIIDLCRKRANF